MKGHKLVNNGFWVVFRYFRKHPEQGLGNKGFPVFDIALIKLSQAAIFTTTVTPICLPTEVRCYIMIADRVIRADLRSSV